MAEAKKKARRQWRDYRTRAGGRPVKAFIDDLPDDEAAAVVAGMKDVAERGLVAAKHLRGEVYEVRADAATRSFRVLFATEGRYSHREAHSEDSSTRTPTCRRSAPRLA